MFKKLKPAHLAGGLKIKNYSYVTRSEGQALIGVLAVVAIASVMVSSLVLTSIISADSSLKLRQSTNLINQADTAMQNAILRLERDPSFTGETLNFSAGQVIIEITGDNPKIVEAKSINFDNKILRKLHAEVNSDNNSAITVSNWSEF